MELLWVVGLQQMNLEGGTIHHSKAQDRPGLGKAHTDPGWELSFRAPASFGMWRRLKAGECLCPQWQREHDDQAPQRGRALLPCLSHALPPPEITGAACLRKTQLHPVKTVLGSDPTGGLQT